MLTRLRPHIPLLLFFVAVSLLLLQFGFALFEYAQHAHAAVTFPFPLDYGEGPILDQTIRLARSENIYRRDVSAPPYTISNYPPLFPLAQVPFVRVFGPAFWYGRAISIFGILIASVCLGLTLYTLTDDWIAAGIAGLTLLAFPYILHCSVLNRVDSLALGFSWTGLCIIVRWPKRRPGILVGGILLSAAIYTKQSYALVAPLTACVWLWQKQERRQAMQLAALVGSLCLGLFLLLNILTDGGFYFNLVTANINAFSVRTAYAYFLEISMTAFYLMFSGLMFLILERLDVHTRSWPLVLPYCLTAAVVGFTSGKAGSWVNYLFEPSSALALAAGAIIAWAGKNYWLKTGAVVLLAFQIHSMVAVSRERFVPIVMTKVHAASEVSELAQIVRNAPEPVLADEYLGLLPLTGHTLYFQPFEFSQLSEAGAWDDSALIVAIQSRQFSIIALFEPLSGVPLIVSRWTKRMRDAIWANYRLHCRLADTWVYVPR